MIESDHNVETLEVNLIFSNARQERIQMFDFKNKDSQIVFKNLTSNTDEFTKCFDNDLKIEEQSTKWRKVLDSYFYKSFKKIRISGKVKKENSEIHDLMNRRRSLKKKQVLEENEEQEITDIESLISEKCQEANRKKVMENFGEINGQNEILFITIIYQLFILKECPYLNVTGCLINFICILN